jgi:hypothetical protein
MDVAAATTAVEQRGFDYLPATRVLLMLNTAKDVFEDIWEWPWLQVLVTGPTPLEIADLKLVLSVRAGNEELLGLDIRQVTQGISPINEPGAPEYWWIEGDHVVHAWPGDGAEITVLHPIDSPELVAPTDTPLIPSRYHSLWLDLAICEAYKDSDNFAGAQALRADVMTRMQDVIMRYETRNRQHSPMMSVRSNNGDD